METETRPVHVDLNQSRTETGKAAQLFNQMGRRSRSLADCMMALTAASDSIYSLTAVEKHDDR